MVWSGGEEKERGPLWLKNVGQRAHVGQNAHHLVVMSAILFIVQCWVSEKKKHFAIG